MTKILSESLKNQYLKNRDSLKLILQNYIKSSIETSLEIDSNKEEFLKEKGFLKEGGLFTEEKFIGHKTEFLQDVARQFKNENKVLEEEVLNGLDSLVILLQEKISTDHLYATFKSKKIDGKYLQIEEDIYIYLNSQYWRLYDLSRGAIQCWKEKNYLVSIISARHIYETIVHSFYFLKKSEKFLNNNDYEKFFHLAWSFIYGWQADYIDEDTRKLFHEEHGEGEFTIHGFLPSIQLPHFNDSLKFYIKEHKNNSTKIEKIKILDGIYRRSSQMAHPNSKGSIMFYHEDTNPDITHHHFKNEQQKGICEETIILNIQELSNFISYQSISILNLKSIFSKLHISDKDLKKFAESFKELNKNKYFAEEWMNKN